MIDDLASKNQFSSSLRQVTARLQRIITDNSRVIRITASILSLLLAVQQICLLTLITAKTGKTMFRDFVQEYVLVRAIAAGENPYLPLPLLVERYAHGLRMPSSILHHPTPHPPTAGLLFLPLSLVDYSTAVLWWLAISLIALVAVMALLSRLVLGHWSIGWTISLTAISLIWVPIIADLSLSNLNLILTCLLVSSWFALRSGRPISAGILLGLSLLIKQIAWPVLLLLLWRRDYRSVIATVATGAIGYLLAGWVVGIDQVITYFREVLPQVGSFYQNFASNISLWTLGPRLFRGTFLLANGTMLGQPVPLAPLFVSAPLASLVSLTVPLVVLGLTMLALRRRLQHEHAFGLAICLSVMISPIAWDHYLVLLLIPIAQVVSWLKQYHFPKHETLLAAVGMLLLLISWDDWLTLGLVLTGSPVPPDSSRSLALLPGLLTIGPMLAVVYLGWFIAWLGQRDLQRSPAAGRVPEAMKGDLDER